MTTIGVGNVRTNIKIAEPSTPANNSEIKLRGIVWSNKVERTESRPQDQTNITKRESGNVPSNNLPDLFSDNSNDMELPNVDDQGYQETQQPPVQSSSGGSEMSTGIGMAIGGVGGYVIGNKLGFKKLGIAIGVAVGGFIGNKVGK